MKNKNLFDSDNNWTLAARECANEISPQLSHIIEKYVRMGYSSREVFYVIQNELNLVESMIILRLRKEKRKAAEKKKNEPA